MDDSLHVIKYLCGHQYPPDPDIHANREELYRAAESFPCPECCKGSARVLHIDTLVYVNMQSLSEEMSALVLEVTQCCPPLENLLALTGYSRRGRSLDELTPGGQVWNDHHAVWRKEFWFAAATNPFHIIALIDLVKEEAHWLSHYLPGGADAIRYLDFPQGEEVVGDPERK